MESKPADAATSPPSVPTGNTTSAETTAQSTPVKPRPDRKRQTPSLSNITIPSPEQAKPSAQERKELPEDEKKNEAVALDELKVAWEGFKEMRMSSAEANESDRIILNKELNLKEDKTVEVIITNQLEKDILGRFETELTQHLREELNNDFIKVTTKLLEIEASKKLYTSKDKFEHMLSQNSNLQLLQEKLGLDYDS
ncbi:MAG: hypothetical protein RIC80_22705 [Cyclobacteriaceae bacterium]